MHVGRNESCPCGSGKKFKACCAGKRSHSAGMIALFVAIAAIAAVGVVASIRKDDAPAPAPVRTASTPKPQPAGPAPAGKVWSVEHGHWHDAAPKSSSGSSPIQISPAAQVPTTRAPQTPKPQPPGPAPAGQVWSPEHGHWHDARTP